MTWEIGLFVALVGILWFIRSPRFKGWVGEKHMEATLRKRLPEQDYQVLNDLILRTDEGTTQVDHVIVSRFGIFVVETKNMRGWIFGAADQSSWTQVVYRRKEKFQNPLRQNYKHAKTIQATLGVEKDKIFNLVAFVGPAVPKTSMPDTVFWGARALTQYVLAQRAVILDESELARVMQAFDGGKLVSNLENRRAHVKHVKALISERAEERPRCPTCGAALVERHARKTGERFLGCSRFPKCRGIRRIT